MKLKCESGRLRVGQVDVLANYVALVERAIRTFAAPEGVLSNIVEMLSELPGVSFDEVSSLT